MRQRTRGMVSIGAAIMAAALAVTLTFGQAAAQGPGGMTVIIGGNTTSSSQDNAQSSTADTESGQTVGQRSVAEDDLSLALDTSELIRSLAQENATGQHQHQSGTSQTSAPANIQSQTISTTVNGGTDLLAVLIREMLAALSG